MRGPSGTAALITRLPNNEGERGEKRVPGKYRTGEPEGSPENESDNGEECGKRFASRAHL